MSEPLLTPEAWEHMNRMLHEYGDSGTVIDVGAAHYGTRRASAWGLRGYFTWEDVDALREVVKQARSAWRVYGADHPAAVRAWDVADRLAALLPPRDDAS